MIKKQDILKILEDMKTDENVDIISEYIDMATSLDSKKLTELLKQRGIKTKADVRKFITTKTTREQHDFKPINDLISFGVNGATLHIHVIPKDLHHMMTPKGIRKAEVMLIDALEKIKNILSTDKNYEHVTKVYAVSNLIARPISRIFERIDFDVKSMDIQQAAQDPELSKFYRRFKNGKNLGRAEISREKILSEEWSKNAAERKEKLEARLEDKFFNTLKSQVNTEVTEKEMGEEEKEPSRDISIDKISNERC